MEIVIEFKKENLAKLKEILLKDDIVSRGTVVFKEAKALGFDKDLYYCYIAGTDEICERAKELVKDIAEITKNNIEIIEKIKEEEDQAMTGFGGIFG